MPSSLKSKSELTCFRYYDAHCHWQDARLQPHQAQILRDLNTAGVAKAVVNGTCPQDWQQVADLALNDKRVLPAFGLHPWHVNTACGKTHSTKVQPTDGQTNARYNAVAANWQWLNQLRQYLEQFPQSAVGEIGLDNWITGADKVRQQAAFLAQLALAAKGNRPVSIHCLRADGDLLDALKAAPHLPQRGIHLHGFAGSIETARQLLDKGAYFSFSEYVATPKRAKARALAEYIPLNRLLAETDAPDMQGSQEWQHYRLNHHPLDRQQPNASASYQNDSPPPKHPANITAAYACLAQLRNLPPAQLAAIIEENFLRYFGR